MALPELWLLLRSLVVFSAASSVMSRSATRLAFPPAVMVEPAMLRVLALEVLLLQVWPRLTWMRTSAALTRRFW